MTIIDVLYQHSHTFLLIISLVLFHFRLNYYQKQVEKKFLENEKKLIAALEKLDVGIFEVKNRTRCKLIDRQNRGKN